jgi:hydrogenase large subunit
MTRIVVDPITRIEGHLRIEAVVENGVITDAFSSGTMVRGLEKILIGRDPRDAWAITERVCGVCTGIHAWHLRSTHCRADPQYHDRHALHPRPCRALLPPARIGLGRHR